MIYLISVIYTTFLSTIVRNFFTITVKEDPHVVTVMSGVNKSKLILIIGLLLIYFCDWAMFLLTFNNNNPLSATLPIPQLLLAIFYIPTIAFLVFALLQSMDTTSEKYCNNLALYFIISAFIESFFIVSQVWLNEKYSQSQIILTFIFLLFYILLKGSIGIILFLRQYTSARGKNISVSRIKPDMIAYASLIVKLGMILAVSETLTAFK